MPSEEAAADGLPGMKEEGKTAWQEPSRQGEGCMIDQLIRQHQ